MSKDKETKISSRSGPTVFTIKQTVAFRVHNFVNGRFSRRGGLVIINLEDQAQYEFSGRAASLWLSLNGTRTLDEAIHHCNKIANIKDPKFPALAYKFVDSLVDLGLIQEVSASEKRNEHAEYMEKSLKWLKKMSTESRSQKSRGPLKMAKLERGDRAALLEVREHFSKLSPLGMKLKIQRVYPASYGGRFHHFKTEVFFPGCKKNEGAGANLTVERAAMAATGEAIERCFTWGFKPEVISKSYNQLKKSGYKVLDPETFNFFSPEQESIKNHEVENLSRASETCWTWFEDAMHSGQATLIPGGINGASEKGRRNPFGETTTNGCAAAFNKDEAKIKAALELIERDSLLFYWRTRNTPAMIDLSKPNERIGRLLEMLGPLKNRISLFHLKTELAPITVQAVIRGRPALGEPRFASANATRLDITEAIEKAVIELLYILDGILRNRASYRSFYGRNFESSIMEFDDRTVFYCFDDVKEAYNFLFPKKPKVISWNNIPDIETGDHKKNLENLLSDFDKNGLRLFFRNNTPANIEKAGFWIYRAFSPDLISIDCAHRYRRLGHGRYHSLAQTLEFERQPKVASQLSPWPHPLP